MLGKSTARTMRQVRDAQNARPDREVDVVGDGDHLAGELEPRYVARAGMILVAALHEQDVRQIQADSANLDHHLPRRKGRMRKVHDPCHVNGIADGSHLPGTHAHVLLVATRPTGHLCVAPRSSTLNHRPGESNRSKIPRESFS